MNRYVKRSYQEYTRMKPFILRKRISKEKPSQRYDNFLIIDFEATCDKYRVVIPQEVIEFPCLRMNAKSLEIESTFHQYVMPVHNPELTSFCVELTGILQEMLVGQPNFERCFELFHEWMVTENLMDTKFAFITCGNWDLKVMLPGQCLLSGLTVPPYMQQWINIKKTFGEVTGLYGHGLMKMLQMLNLNHVGRHHSGIDDCRNIANIVKVLAQRHTLAINGKPVDS